MSEVKQGLVRIGVVALGYAISGCSGAEVSAGSEGDAINLNRCYGADCGVHAQSLSGSGADARPCGGVVGALEEPLLFESISDVDQALAAHEAPDGTVWALLSVHGTNEGYARIVLARFGSDGALLATSDVIGTEEDHTYLDAALAVDSTGEATVGLYTSYAPNADVDPSEELTLYGFDRDLQPVGVSRTFRGMASPRLVGGVGGSVWLAGNAFGNAAHGAIAHITQHEPDWIQTAVPTAGQSVGGVSGLTVADDGVAAVVARLNPRWSGEGPNIVKLGLATFDVAGKPLWTLELPGDYTQGFLGSLGGSAEGNLVVAGMVGENNDESVVRSVSRSGQLGWAYSLQGGFGVDVEVRRDSGRTFASTGSRLAVIDAAGDSCRQFSLPGPLAAPRAADSPAWDPDAEYVLATGGSLARFRVPE
jgi:hypothetical protein